MSDGHELARMDSTGLRERNTPQKAPTAELAKETVQELNAEEGNSQKKEKDKRTFGRTPDGTIFTVPQTHDMVSQLLSPSQPKNFSDILVLAVLAVHILTLYYLPSIWRIPCFAATFLFWRMCYNAGIGYLLHIQSNHRRLVNWAKRSNIFEDPSTGKNPNPTLYKLLKRELETKIPKNYKFEEAPIEYNTWLVFRRVVDLILMCDFVSYCLFAIACGGRPANESVIMTGVRWFTGFLLFGFNLWVKLDAHRVVKDYAWYWGDFFYLIDQELTFDGVFEMAPHPMYSVGYAGYYGISLMAASYKVLTISVMAHAAQFAFLVWVENPHIDKTYNPPPTRQETEEEHEDVNGAGAQQTGTLPPLSMSTKSPYPVHNLLGFHNFDFYRITDVAIILLQLHMLALATLTPSTPAYQAMFVVNAAVWRLWYSLGIGYILDRQSNKKKWTRHFLKFGESTAEAWRQWKSIYHLSMTMCYASFIAAVWKTYELPDQWAGMDLFKHVLGFGLISLQVWTAISIYDSLGEFGWFFGDFFFDEEPKLTYSGIYRFLNSPERVIGLAGVWGAALISGRSSIFFLALLSHILTLSFIQFIERPHMQRLYGESLRRDSGLTRSIKRSLPPPIRRWQGSVDKLLEETVDFVEELIDAARPKIAAGVSSFVKDSTALFKHPTRISITRLAPDLAGYDPKDYSIEIEHPKDNPFGDTTSSGNRSRLTLPYGNPINIRWTAPADHGKKDWIGLYMVADNSSREITRLPSQGRWIATVPNQYDSSTSDLGLLTSNTKVAGKGGKESTYVAGTMEFAGDKLWWTQGVFEFRYHHNGKHNVMALSEPFSIQIPRFVGEETSTPSASVDQLPTTEQPWQHLSRKENRPSTPPQRPLPSPSQSQSENINIKIQNGTIQAPLQIALLSLVRDCLDRDPEIAPSSVTQSFGSLVSRDGKYARRVVYVVKHMFGIEFAPEVVQADGNVRNLAWRVANARIVLAPFSMGGTGGAIGGRERSKSNSRREGMD
ncbi:phosphatidylethanolamine N-methyltransferase [Agyrium rufum]|nr:phosphatidylethanolamine N-methyltransferase [Agyrium rufum]